MSNALMSCTVAERWIIFIFNFFTKIGNLTSFKKLIDATVRLVSLRLVGYEIQNFQINFL